MPTNQDLTPPQEVLDKLDDKPAEAPPTDTGGTKPPPAGDPTPPPAPPVTPPPDDTKPPVEPPKEDIQKQIIGGINELGTSIRGLTDRLEGVEEKVQGIPSPVEPTAPTTPPAETPPEDEFEPATKGDVKKIVGAEVEKGKAAETAATQAEEEKLQKADAFLDKAEQYLEKDGYLPAIKNPDDPNDPGVAGRRELYGYAARTKSDDIGACAKHIKSMHEMGVTYDPIKNKYFKSDAPPAPGKTAPVSTPGVQPAPVDGIKPPTTKEIQATDMDDMPAKAMGEEA